MNADTIGVGDGETGGHAILLGRVPQTHGELHGTEHVWVRPGPDLSWCPKEVETGRVLRRRRLDVVLGFEVSPRLLDPGLGVAGWDDATDDTHAETFEQFTKLGDALGVLNIGIVDGAHQLERR